MENQQKKGIYLIMDLEMTGLNPFEHGVIEVGMIVMNKQFEIIDEFCVDLCPPKECVIDMEALEYNGFTMERIQKGKSYEDFVQLFLDFFQKNFSDEQKPIIVGQYITADLSFLASVFFRAGRNDIYLKLGNDIIDTKSIANQQNAIARYKDEILPFKSTSLSKVGGLSEVLGVSSYVAHTARGDIFATREVLIRFLGVE